MNNYYLKKLSSITIFLLLLLISIGLGYYLFLDYKEKTTDISVDLVSIQENRQELDKLYTKLNDVEVDLREHSTDYKTKNYLQSEYNTLLKLINEKKSSIDSILKPKNNLSIFDFIFQIKILLIIVVELMILFVLINIIFGFLTQKREEKITNSVYGVSDGAKKSVKKSYDQRDDLENSYEKIKEKTQEVFVENDYNVKQYSSINKDELDLNENSQNEIIENIDFKRSKTPDYLDQLNSLDLSDNQQLIEDYEYQHQKDLKLKLNIKKKEERLKKLLKNPKVEMIVSYYKNGESLFSISELTGLSKDEISFVISMWESMVKEN